MSEFVEECRREWKRLRVPDPIANEMAADLVADLNEAEADGASPEEVLGNAAFDARTFAATWAMERGLVEHGWRESWREKIRTRPVGAIVLLVVVLAAAGAAIGVVASTHHAPGSAAPAFSTPATASSPARIVSVTNVPDVIGLQQEQALAAARAAGLTVKVVEVDADRPAGTVVKEDPSAGAQLARGATLTLSVAKQWTVPDDVVNAVHGRVVGWARSGSAWFAVYLDRRGGDWCGMRGAFWRIALVETKRLPAHVTADRRLTGAMCGNSLAWVHTGRFSDGEHPEAAFMLWTTPSIGATTYIYRIGGEHLRLLAKFAGDQVTLRRGTAIVSYENRARSPHGELEDVYRFSRGKYRLVRRR